MFHFTVVTSYSALPSSVSSPLISLMVYQSKITLKLQRNYNIHNLRGCNLVKDGLHSVSTVQACPLINLKHHFESDGTVPGHNGHIK